MDKPLGSESIAPKPDDDDLTNYLAAQLPRLAQHLRLRLGPRLRAHESASDLAQSAAREVLEDLQVLPTPNRDALRVWLYHAAERKLIDKARYWSAERRDPARARSFDALASQHRGVADDPSRRLEAREQLADVAAALQRLDPVHREIILLARVAELPHSMIAQLTARSEGASRMMLARALAALSKLL
ncbi:MAG: RNA polymerase sigma factor [Planctomycetota bacterium]